jgi:acetyltransferase-like isoleucine patch superfamily enzyme
LNIELTFRAIIRKIQAIFGIVNVSYFEMMKLVFRRLYIQLKGLIRSHFLRLCGLKIGKNTRIFGKTIIKGNRKNIIIGNQVSILGNIQLITEYSRSRELIQIGDNTIIDNDTILFSHGGQLIIGSDCFIGSSVRIQAKGGVYIGNDTMIAANTSIFASNHITDRNDVPYKKQGEKFIGISIGQNCWIGSNVVILDGADIGDSCIIGANCIIKGQYPSNSKIVAKEIIGKPYNESEKRE